jgi:hypothetical protein
MNFTIAEKADSCPGGFVCHVFTLIESIWKKSKKTILFASYMYFVCTFYFLRALKKSHTQNYLLYCNVIEEWSEPTMIIGKEFYVIVTSYPA